MVKEEITAIFLDVGQGDSTVIILPDKFSAIVVDCPLNPTTINYLEAKKINNLYVFLTHTDLDHMGGIANLVENFEQVNFLAYNHDTFLIAQEQSKRRLILKHLGQLIERRGIETFSPQAGQSWTFQGLEVEVLHPHDRDIKRTVPRGDTNNASAVLRITFEEQRILLTADIEGDGWQWITERGTDLKADILKFPHHGAWYKAVGQQPLLESILDQIDPKLVILSVGTNNTHHHPRIQTFKLLRSRPLLRFVCTEATDQCYSSLKSAGLKAFPCGGTVEIVIEKSGRKVNPDRMKHLAVIQIFDNAQCNAKP